MKGIAAFQAHRLSGQEGEKIWLSGPPFFAWCSFARSAFEKGSETVASAGAKIWQLSPRSC